jgi:hypothetical protein
MFLPKFSGLLSLILLLGANAHPNPNLANHHRIYEHSKRADITVDSFNATEYPIALQGLFANIGISGSKAAGAAAGIVLASPSKSELNSSLSLSVFPPSIAFSLTPYLMLLSM